MKQGQDQFEITAQPQNAGVARARVRQVALASGMARPALDDLEVAVGEAVTNAILYGSPSDTSRIVITAWYAPEDNAFCVEIQDQGQGFNPEQIRGGSDTDALGGRGVRLMRALMDHVHLHYDGGGMCVQLVKSLPIDG